MPISISITHDKPRKIHYQFWGKWSIVQMTNTFDQLSLLALNEEFQNVYFIMDMTTSNYMWDPLLQVLQLLNKYSCFNHALIYLVTGNASSDVVVPSKLECGFEVHKSENLKSAYDHIAKHYQNILSASLKG